MRNSALMILLSLAVLSPLAGCRGESAPQQGDVEKGAGKAAEPAVLTDFTVKFETSKGEVLIRVHPQWAPLGAAHFKKLVEQGYYDGNRFYRVVPNFIVQFGLNGDPTITRKHILNRLRDDPVVTTNARGTITFATSGPHTRATDLFINLKANAFLDNQGFSPFGEITKGMEVIDALNAEYGEKPDQGRIRGDGASYLDSYFPRLDYIQKATILP